jgi:replicative DNA helicase
MMIAVNMAHKGNNVAIFSLEMGAEQLTERLIANVAGIDSNKIRTGKGIDDGDWTKIVQATNIISNLKLKIYDDVRKIEEIRAECRELKNNNQLDYVVIDYLQLCESMNKAGNTNERVSYLSRQFKLISGELKVPILLLSQLSRANEADNRRPKLTDLRDSGSIEQDADNVFLLHDESYGKYVESNEELKADIDFIVAKQRSGDRDVFTKIQFYKKTQRWYGGAL